MFIGFNDREILGNFYLVGFYCRERVRVKLVWSGLKRDWKVRNWKIE